MIKMISIVATLFVLLLPVNAQIKSGERLVFAGSYNMRGLMTNIAQLTMSTSTVNTSKNSFLNLKLEIETFKKWDSFFKIRDLYESFVVPSNLKPALYKRNVYEGGYTKTEKYTFMPDGKTVRSVSKLRNNPERQSTFTIGNSTTDVVTLIYKLRTANFAALKPGQLLSYTMVFDEKQFPVSFRYLGKETVKAGNLGMKECYKLAVVSNSKKLGGGNSNLIWLTADAKRIPAQVLFSIPVGIGQLTLTSATGI